MWSVGCDNRRAQSSMRYSRHAVSGSTRWGDDMTRWPSRSPLAAREKVGRARVVNEVRARVRRCQRLPQLRSGDPARPAEHLFKMHALCVSGNCAKTHDVHTAGVTFRRRATDASKRRSTSRGDTCDTLDANYQGGTTV